uniref:Coatomer subunit zeta n=1 Tax=Macrostomum lignano TaxID=282301 RepID=A0A1I8J1J7_9PLAT
LQDISLHTVRAILILDNDGRRIVAKYYTGAGSSTVTVGLASAKDQRLFERRLLAKTAKNPSTDVLMFEGLTCLFRSNVDLLFCVLGDSNENELILNTVLCTLFDAVSIILRKNVEKRALLDYLDVMFLVVDELCDNGIVLETDAHHLVARVGTRVIDESSPMEGSVTQVLQQATQQFKWALLK